MCVRRIIIKIIIIIIIISIIIIVLPTVGKGAVSVAFVSPSTRLSVCLSVRRVYIE